jgi:hypothetical protein
MAQTKLVGLVFKVNMGWLEISQPEKVGLDWIEKHPKSNPTRLMHTPSYWLVYLHFFFFFLLSGPTNCLGGLVKLTT